MKSWFFFFSMFIYGGLSYAQTEHSIPLDHSTIHLTTFGQGEPILIINGGPGMNSEGFASLAQELGKSNLAIIYDQRGTGKSSAKHTMQTRYCRIGTLAEMYDT